MSTLPKAMQKHWVMDIETTACLFAAVFEHYFDNTRHVFVVSQLLDNFDELLIFLDQNVRGNEWHISYNGIAFDSQVIQWIMINRWKLLKMSGDERARAIYAYSQSVIDKSKNREWSDYPLWKLKIRQIDIFKMNHWDSAAKTSSLKWIQYSTDWENMEEMPLHHTHEIRTMEELDMTINYCINDVASTKRIFQLSKEQVQLRKNLTNSYGIDLYSASEPRISKELFAHFLSEKMNVDKKWLKTLRTPRSSIIVKDIILPYIKFTTPEFKRVEQWFNNLVIDYTVKMTKEERKKLYSFSTNYKGCKTDYGLGGLHGIHSGHHKIKPGYTIMTSDVISFYPRMAMLNKWSPAHLPQQIFCDQYEWFFNERVSIPKSDPRNYVYKIILNATYGLSSDENCYLYDPLFTMQITVNGQLSLSMLYEMLAERIPEAIPLMQNTDGLEMMIPDQYKSLYMDICTEWEKMTLLKLEHDEYRELIAPDVNNYIAISKTGKTKEKGRFEWEDQTKMKTAALHKNKSFLVVPKAIYAYYMDDILPENYLKSNTNIFDYCAGAKAKGESRFEARFVRNTVYQTEKQSKVIRYYMSGDDPKAVKLFKIYPTGKEQQVVAGSWKQVTCNQIDIHKPFSDYNIDTSYYLQAIYKEIGNMNKNANPDNAQQLELLL
jgi:hypothetical protein